MYFWKTRLLLVHLQVYKSLQILQLMIGEDSEVTKNYMWIDIRHRENFVSDKNKVVSHSPHFRNHLGSVCSMMYCYQLWVKGFLIFILTCGTQSYNIKLGYADFAEWLPYYASAINMAVKDVQNQTNWFRDSKVR